MPRPRTASSLLVLVCSAGGSAALLATHLPTRITAPWGVARAAVDGLQRGNGGAVQLGAQVSDDSGLGREFGAQGGQFAATIFGADRWGACLEAESEGVKLEALAVATSHDLAFTAIVGAGHDGARVQVKPLQHAPGQSWALQRIIELSKKSDCPVVIDDRSAASPLIAALERAGVKVVNISAPMSRLQMRVKLKSEPHEVAERVTRVIGYARE